MAKQIMLLLRPDDAEPILREAAEMAAKFSAWCDYMTDRVWSNPKASNETTAAAKVRWQKKFLRAKRIVEAFGVEYEQTTEAEAMTIEYRYIGEKRKSIGGLMTYTSGGKPDYKNPEPAYRREVHAEACRQAADRVVRRWLATIEVNVKAA
jgi:hypothetical protein